MAFRQGLRETGVEAENVSIVYRWAENRAERLPELAADLVRLKASVIATAGPPAAFAAKAATTTIPMLFIVAVDPVGLGLVASLDRPGGNLTGINLFNSEIAAKRFALLHELVPQAKRVAVLVDPADAANCAASKQRVVPSGCKRKFSTPAGIQRSMLHSMRYRRNGTTLFLSAHQLF